MELELLLKYLMPIEFFYFDFKEIKKESENVLLILLDEKIIKPSEHSNKELVSNGFDEPVCIQNYLFEINHCF